MRGHNESQVTILSLVTPDQRVPKDDPLRVEESFDHSTFSRNRQRLLENEVAQKFPQTRDKRRRSAVDGRTTRHPGYVISQRIRKRVEEIFGWTKTVASFRKTRFKGQARTQLAAHLVAAAYNLLRIAKLTAAQPWSPPHPALSPGGGEGKITKGRPPLPTAPSSTAC
jgi:hypothetical protein